MERHLPDWLEELLDAGLGLAEHTQELDDLRGDGPAEEHDHEPQQSLIRWVSAVVAARNAAEKGLGNE